jgi:hypothetical protein
MRQAPYRTLLTPVIVGTIQRQVRLAPPFGSNASLNDRNSQWGAGRPAGISSERVLAPATRGR